MFKLKKGDIVAVISGKDRGKRGKIINIFAASNKALVENINVAKKHKRQTRQDQQGGIVNIEMPIAISNLMLVCKSCNKPARVGLKIAKDGKKERFCKKCQGVL
ncbi:MAG TPA: 50S ribosomal protein L24 [Candidatus Omnitrophota bacterium]|jgi:large subunit ribosomal protein L24|nr:50S ribosomal protein L24 [Candidatus Omnitrophota bacterium]HRZ15700.1 50S ribosomal protein L24 [Candidatus Omnitrophota bacterium]